MNPKESCYFCNIGDGRIGRDAMRVSRSIFEAHGIGRLIDGLGIILAESEHLVAFPDAFPVSESGHVLVVPKDHRYSFAQLENARNDEVGRFVYSIGETIMRDGYVWVEHGAVEDGQSNQSVYHVHGHMIATEREALSELDRRMRKLGVTPRQIDFTDEGIIKTLKRMVDGSSYLLAKQGRLGKLVVENGQSCPLPSQFGQRMMSEIVDGERDNRYDWKNIESDQEMQRTAIQRTLGIVDDAKR